MTGRNLLLGITIVIFCLFLLIVLTTKRNQPLYQGKTVHYWIRDYAFNSGGIGSQSRYESAIQALGTNAIPALLDCLRAKDSALTTPLFNLAIKHHWPALRPVRAIELHLAGFMGFYALGANGSPAVPALMKIYEEKDSP